MCSIIVAAAPCPFAHLQMIYWWKNAETDQQLQSAVTDEKYILFPVITKQLKLTHIPPAELHQCKAAAVGNEFSK